MLKIENAYVGYKISFVGIRSSINVRTGDELLNAVAHYFELPLHDKMTCPVCKKVVKDIRRELNRREVHLGEESNHGS